MDELHHWQQWCPIILLEVTVDPEVLLQPLVCAFRLSIHLWVICGADVLCDVQLFAQFCCKIWCEVSITIRNDPGRDPEVWENMLHIERRHSLTCNGLVTWEKQKGLAAVVVCDYEDGVIPFWWWQINDEIQGNYTEGYKGMLGCDREQGNLRLPSSCFGHLTDSAALDVILDKFPKSRPPVALWY